MIMIMNYRYGTNYCYEKIERRAPDLVCQLPEAGRKMKIWSLLFLLMCLECIAEARFLLSHVPDIVHPPVPSIVRNATEAEEGYLDPEVSPGLYQGDIALTNEFYNYWRVELRFDVFPDRMWKNGIVPIYISPLYARIFRNIHTVSEPSDRVTIMTALRILNFMTCVRFVHWDGKAKDFILIWPTKYPEGCWSFVGRYGGAQLLSLQAPDKNGTNCLGTEGNAIHELMHALGFFHEQARWDRDRFVTIHEENIIPKYESEFEKQSKDNTTYSSEYDYDSIMHYGEFYFTKEKGKPTITPKQPGVKIGQRKGMSKRDCLKVNDLYGCFKDPRSTMNYYDISEEEYLDPEVSPGLFQGDIYNNRRVGLRKWKNGIVPYTISPVYKPSDRASIIKAIRLLNYITCVRFYPWDGKAKDYLRIMPVNGCSSNVGRSGGPQTLSLESSYRKHAHCLGTQGRVIHELMHALGFFHEHSRWDRDRFVTIHKENIIPEFSSAFEKESRKNTTYRYEYDYDSIMHYSKFQFTKEKGKPTITPKQPGARIGQRKGMSKTDCMKVNDLYGCFKKPGTDYYSVCHSFGI
ncbi:hypothetical protein JTB14_037203 [Gonioctena quinquepunctata]|nr:hypothetical protein JTB14_037203 [Gonioctena quinquepunctata]